MPVSSNVPAFTIEAGPKPVSTVQSSPSSVAFIHFPDLVDATNSVIGISQIPRVIDQIKSVLRAIPGLDITRMETLGSEGVYCFVDTGVDEAALSMKAVLDAFKAPIEINLSFEDMDSAREDEAFHLMLQPYIGIASDDENDSEIGRNQARICAQWALKGNGTCIHTYNEIANTTASISARARQAMMRAIRAKELTQQYQPQIDYRTGEIVGIEALLRGPQGIGKARYPDLPQSAPAMLELAEQTGMMDELTALVWDQALEALGMIDRLVPCARVGLSLNMTGRYLVESFETIASRIQKLPEPHRLTLEITEEASLQGHEMRALQSVLSEMRDMGIRVAVDDFGVGYSNVARIKELTFDELKLDKALIEQIPEDDHDLRVVQQMIRLAKSRGVRVVTEGVETVEQWDLLKRFGADIAQGFLMSRPRPLHDIIARLQHQSKWNRA